MLIPYNKEWIFIEKEDYANYLFVVPAWEGYASPFIEKFGFNRGQYLGAEYIDGACVLFALKETFDSGNRQYYDLLFKNPGAWDKLHKATILYSDRLFKFGSQLLKSNPGKLSNGQIVKLISKFNKFQADTHDTRGPMWFMETPVNIVSDYLQKYLQENAEGKNVTMPLPTAFRVMITASKENIYSKEKKGLAKVAMIDSEIEKASALKKHAKKYEWLEYGLQGKILKLDHFEVELRNSLAKGPKKFFEKLKEEENELTMQRKQAISEYKIDKTHQRIFLIVRNSIYSRLYSKLSQFYGYYAIEHIFKEIGKRAFLTLEQIRYLAPQDFANALKGADVSELANERKKYSVHISNNGKTGYWLGEKAMEIKKKLSFYEEKKEAFLADLLKGQPAYPGIAKGRVKIIYMVSELPKMHSGNVLVSHMTNPDIVPAMKMAAAIVTDLGGITCHAAIVSRELKVPCVIGTKFATAFLKDGDLVEVDAAQGVIRKIL